MGKLENKFGVIRLGTVKGREELEGSNYKS
jgi:hypothetical protein